ncbi:histidine phosphatase family protein [Actinomadura sp. WMMB 499]|uniref:SixA phosphatase family protein n=1 Tax=Actinomadura sp. WMMB 499 TaxID=1219491 RepID=UPI0012464D9A|nr:histidine phosphatase family protein [Actinomadura sp. WMMB 499]QFG23307.1 histidine phosphatase family protein [Actinomadura sp. WMMB 499]
MPTLIVLRHAKAESGPGKADIDRTLADRGRRDATATGEWLRARGLVPGYVLCSTAARTRETLERLAFDDVDASFESRIYDNDPGTLLDLVRGAPDGAATVLLVGHNPSVHLFVHDLAGESPDGFPTCALAVIDLPDGWADVRPGAGTLVTSRTPKD